MFNQLKRNDMEYVYLIEFVADHFSTCPDKEDHVERRVFGVFNTARRAICYMRPFFEEKEDCYGAKYYDNNLTVTEDEHGYSGAKATRKYKCDGEIVTEKLKMTRYTMNGPKSPSEEIMDTYC